MNDPERDSEVKKLVFILGTIFIIGLVCLAFWGSYQLKEYSRKYEIAIAKLEGRIPNVKDGTPGERGLLGEKGDTGSQGPKGDKGDKGDMGNTGNNGNNGSSIEGPAGAQGPKGDTGAQGPQGEPGPPGRTVFTRTNPITGQGECRYAGNDEWMPESECQ